MAPDPTNPVAAMVTDSALEARAQRDARLCAWVQDSARGNAQAFEQFYDATLGYARALARRLLRDTELEDVLADAYFQAWREAPRFDGERGSALAWLLTIVRSRALDLLRQRRRADAQPGTDLPELASDAPGPADLLALAQAGTRLHSALTGLSTHERWVLTLAYYREMSHTAIAQATALPLGTVKSLIVRAQQKLRARLTS